MNAIGHSLMEEMIYRDGQLLNPNLIDYRVPTFQHLPKEFETILVESQNGPGPFGSKGTGEGGLLPVAAAIGNAVFRATGLRLYDLPLTPEKVWLALQEKDVCASRSRSAFDQLNQQTFRETARLTFSQTSPSKTARKKTSPRSISRPTSRGRQVSDRARSSAAPHRKNLTTRWLTKKPTVQRMIEIVRCLVCSGDTSVSGVSPNSEFLLFLLAVKIAAQLAKARISVGMPMTHGNRPARKPKLRLCQSASASSRDDYER